jgi:transcription elongation GreA/GreB family factor
MQPTTDTAPGDAPLYTTERGYRRFLARIAKARADYDVVVASNSDAADAGDNSVWHDNFAYEENQRQMHQLARRVRDLEGLARRITVVPPRARFERVTVGCAVTLDDDEGRSERVVIGGYEDSDTAFRRVAYTAPLGQALLGAEEGDARTLQLAGRVREVTVITIEPARPEEL